MGSELGGGDDGGGGGGRTIADIPDNRYRFINNGPAQKGS